MYSSDDSEMDDAMQHTSFNDASESPKEQLDHSDELKQVDLLNWVHRLHHQAPRTLSSK